VTEKEKREGKIWRLKEKFVYLQRQTSSLATPLSAGSKTEPPLLYLKAAIKGSFYFSYILRKIR